MEKVREVGERRAGKAERILGILLAAVALVLGTVVTVRAVTPPARSDASSRRLPHVDEWESLLRVGRTQGSPNAKVKVIEFSDLQCPYCARFHGKVQQRLESQRELSYTFVHFPGPRHPDAKRMAIGAECAASEGQFFGFVHLAFEHQDSLGALTESDVARQAGVRDLGAFVECLESPEPIRRVDEGLRWGRELAVTGTPTVLVNGYRIPSVQRDSVLLSVVEAIRLGSDPRALPWWRRLPSWWQSRPVPARAGSERAWRTQ